MHSEILTREQRNLLPLVGKFKKQFGLVGGTAIALHIGHRESVDFDLFSPDEFSNANIRAVFRHAGKTIEVLRADTNQFTFLVDDVHITFFYYPYPIKYVESLNTFARIPTLLTLAAMKAFALGRRSKWKDYVDLYYILKNFYTLNDISIEAEALFAQEFNGKLFRQQLSYFEDINYAEPVIFKPGFEVPNDEIKHALTEYSLA